jgi:hypothetical protein
MDATRVKRLKDLVERLEQMPASPDRDRILGEVRSRAVDVDTGVTPRAMLPVREPVPPRQERPVRVAATAARRPPAPAERPRLVAAAELPQSPELLVWPETLLSLEDAATPHDAHAIPAWRLGLRA